MHDNQEKKLTLIKRCGKSSSGRFIGLFRCFCGKEFTGRYDLLFHGHTKSCGCIRNAHGLVNSPEYKAWKGLMWRTSKSNKRDYEYYLRRGIGVCERWKKFSNFYNDMPRKPKGDYSLDRVDNDKGYEPGNCRWATMKTQNRNSRKVFREINIDGQVKRVQDWCLLLETVRRGYNKVLHNTLIRRYNLKFKKNIPLV